jgi:ankyrin repeat protein
MLWQNNPKLVNTTAIGRAADEGKLEEVERLIASGCDINQRDKVTGYTALMHAVKRSFTDVIGILLSKGANVNLLNNVSYFHSTNVSYFHSTKNVCVMFTYAFRIRTRLYIMQSN